MPQYEYECNNCGERFSMLRRMSDSDDTIQCPKCGVAKPRRLISSFATGGCGNTSGSSIG